MLIARLKFASSGILAAITLASAGVVAVAGLRPDEPTRAMKRPNGATGTAAVSPTRSRDANGLPQAPAASGPPIEGVVRDKDTGRPLARVGVRAAVYEEHSFVPGLKYGGGASEGFKYLGELFHDLTVKPGEVKDLGDLKPVPPNGI
jgi:hypothetical protein